MNSLFFSIFYLVDLHNLKRYGKSGKIEVSRFEQAD